MSEERPLSVCAHHDVMELKWEHTKESIEILTKLHQESHASLNKNFHDLNAKVEGLGAKITLIIVIATPIWAALAGVVVKYLSGLPALSH